MKAIKTFNYEVKQAKSTIMLRATMTLLMVVMTCASAWADTSYITDLMLIGKNNKTEANALKEQYVEQGWMAIDQDLNAGAGGDYIFLLYKVGGLASANQSFITDIYISTDKISNILDTRTINGRQYNLVRYDGDDHFKEKKGDLNSNAGGDDIHLYYTKDNYTDCKAISSIMFNETSSGSLGKNGKGQGYDLNTGAGGDDIFMHCTCNYAPGWIIEKTTDGGRCIIKGFMAPPGDIKYSYITVFPSILGDAQVIAVGKGLEFRNFTKLETIYVNDDFDFAAMLPIDTKNENKVIKHIHVVDEGGNVIRPDELPTSVKNIPDSAFFNCTGLTSITIPASVKNIGGLAFKGCTGLKSFTIPASVTTIGDGAFLGCSNLAAVHVNKDNPNYKSIDGVLLDKAGKTILLLPAAYPTKNYVIPDGVTNIGGIFTGRTDLTGITIPGSVTSIGQEAFSGCTSLKNATIKSGDIGYQAFNNCSALTSVTIDNGVKNIGQKAFYKCPLTNITIPGSVESIGQEAFSNCSSLKNATIKSGDIGYQAFNNCSALTSVTIDNGVKSIGELAFCECTALKSVNIEYGVKSIGKDAFYHSPLTSITIPGSVKSIENNPFYGCNILKSVTIENGVKSIGQKAFSGCASLTSITIPASVESIGQEAFWGCTSIESITIPASVTSIGEKAFSTCSALKNITIPGSVTSIGQNAFWNCSAMKNITIPGSVESIELKAFDKCFSLESVTIKDGVKSIGQNAFSNCTSLTSITIPGSVESIGQSTFENCASLKSVTIKDGVTSIGQGAFMSCTSLTSITIPSSVTSIGDVAFFACGNLASVSIMGNPKIGDSAIPKGVTVTLSLTSNDANGAKWMTFYNDRYNFQADENTTVYKATVVGQSLVLTEVADKIVNGATRGNNDIITAPATAVILKSTGNPVMTRVTDRSSDTQPNDLVGTMEATATPANTYTLANGSKGVGFYRYTGDKVAAGKAYLVHNGASAAREFIGFDEEGETTGIVAIDHSPLTIDHSPFTIDHSPFTIDHSAGAWYSIDGRKLQGGPSKKGIYVRNGIKVVIK